MRKAKLVALCVLILSFSLTMITPAMTQHSKKTSRKKASTSKVQKKETPTDSDPVLELGAKVFDVNCSACHDGGGNTIEAEKTLLMDSLKANGFAGIDDVKKRIEEGAGIMPVFKDQLKPEEIDAVSAFVWQKAQKEWK